MSANQKLIGNATKKNLQGGLVQRTVKFVANHLKLGVCTLTMSTGLVSFVVGCVIAVTQRLV